MISLLSSLVAMSFIAQSTCFLQPKFQSFVNPRRILHLPLLPENTPPPSSSVLPSPNQVQEQSPPLTCVLETKFQSFVNPRRILHQPLFPENTTPPAPSPPPPPPPSSSVLPFFPKIPSGVSPNQAQEQPPPPPLSPVAITQKEKSKLGSKKRFAIAILVGIVISGILLFGLGFFYLYKYKMKDLDESQKPNRRNLILQDSILPSSTFLHIGTMGPPAAAAAAQRLNLESSSSADNKRLNSVKFSDYYRPSPELQPLPPLTKPPLPPSPHLSSSDEEESHESTFYTPNGSSLSNEEGSNSNTSSLPHSKRTSPKSRIQNGKPAILFPPPIRPKFSAPPPPPDFARLQLITKQVHEMSKPPIPPPPPPPVPPQLSARRVVLVNKPNPEFSSSTLQEACKVDEERDVVNSSLERNYGDEVDESRPKLKPLHWDKVRATSDRATVWDKLKSSSFQLDEDIMESLFGCESSISVPKEVKRKSVLPPPHVEPQTSVLDPKKSHNIAILLRALNVTRDEVSKALLDGNLEGLGPELLETLVKMAPTKEEEIKLRDYNGDTSRLGSAERFLKAILDIPLAFKRVDAMLYRANFDTEVNYLIASFLMLEEASKELKNSKLFLKLLEAVLRTGNRMNVGTNRGDARSFKLDTLLKLADVKGTDGKTTLLHFVVQEIIRSEETDEDHTSISISSSGGSKDENFRKQGLHVLAGLSKELVNVKKAATTDSTVLNSYVSKLELGLEKVRLVLQYEKPSMEGKFFESMNKFIQEAEKSIAMIKSLEQKALSSVKEVTHYFHGDASKEEAHPFRIFVIVRDFLSTLDNVCKEVRKIQDRSMVVGTSTSFRAPVSVSASLPILRRYDVRKEGSSSDSFSP